MAHQRPGGQQSPRESLKPDATRRHHPRQKGNKKGEQGGAAVATQLGPAEQ